MLDQLQHISTHPRSLIKRMAVEYYSTDMIELLVWQDEESWVNSDCHRRLAFSLKLTVTEFTQYCQGDLNTSHIKFPQQEFDLFHWVSRNEDQGE